MFMYSSMMKICSRCRESKPLTDFYKQAASRDAHASRCKHCTREVTRAWIGAHPEKFKQHCRNWNSRNRLKRRAIAKKWRKNNPGKNVAHSLLRQTKIKRATPAWFERRAVEQIYVNAARISAETEFPHVVDHIVPLTSKLVCGLHCLANLQILSADKNTDKHNLYWPDRP